MIDIEPISASKIPSWKYNEIECKVVDLYVEQDIRESPINPFAIMEKRGYILVPFSKLGTNNYSIFKNGDNDAFSFYSPKDNTFIIAYDGEKPLIRLRFTLMHELGHIELGHKCESDLARRMADYYAAYALAPTPLIRFLTNGNVEKIADTFKVSYECATICAERHTKRLAFGGDCLREHEFQLLKHFYNY